MFAGLSGSRAPDDPPAGQVAYRGDLVPPTRSYAATLRDTAIGSHLRVPAATAWTGSPMVHRMPRRDGLRFFFGHGGEETPTPQTRPGGNDGLVQSSAFQRVKIRLTDFILYDGLFSAGYPRNLGLSFRVPAIATQKTGGPTTARMNTKPAFTRVQTVGRYSTVPASYATRSART